MAWLVVSNSVIPNNMQNRFYNHIIASIICIMADFQNGSFSRIFGAFWSACLHRTNLILNLLYCGKKKLKNQKVKNWKAKNKKQKHKNGQWPLWASVRYRHGRWIECFWETNERQCILDKLDCDDQLLSDGSDISSEIDDADKREYDSYDSDKFSKDSLSGDVCGHRYDTVSF